MHELFECLFHCFVSPIHKVFHVHLAFDMRKNVLGHSCLACVHSVCVFMFLSLQRLQSDKEGNNIVPCCKLNDRNHCMFVTMPFSSFWQILSHLHCSFISLEDLMSPFSLTVLSSPFLCFTADSELTKISDFKIETQFHRDALCVSNGLEFLWSRARGNFRQ